VDDDKIISLWRIPVLTQAEVESVRTPDDITRIVRAQPEREYQLVRGAEPADPPPLSESSLARKRRHSAILQTISLGAAGYAFGISSASSILHLTVGSGVLATTSAVALWMAGWWVYRSRNPVPEDRNR
jgi:hypothetical protein